MKFPRLFFRKYRPIISKINKIDINDLQQINLSLQDGSNFAGRIIVKKGQFVFKNQILTLPEINSNNAPIHSPCDGVIEDIGYDDHLYIKELKSAVIRIKASIKDANNDNNKAKNIIHSVINYQKQELITKLRYSGIIGLGGAGFPSFKKISNEKIEYLIVNAVECEPPISADAALMSEIANIEKIIKILRQISLIFGNTIKIIIAIEDNKPFAIENFNNILKAQDTNQNFNITIKSIPTAYPNGDAKYLIKQLFGIEIPKNKHSTDFGIVCFNVATIYSMYNALFENTPLTKRIITISGNLIKEARNYEIHIGTKISTIIEYLENNKLFIKTTKNLKITMGGYLMGTEIVNLDAGILKTTNSLIIDENVKDLSIKSFTEECINCGLCVSNCPQKLLPQQLYKFSKNKDLKNLQDHFIDHCIECKMCDVICPSNINITQYIQYGKTSIKTDSLQHQNAEELKLRYENLQNRKLKEQNEKAEKSKIINKIDKSELLKKALAKAKKE